MGDGETVPPEVVCLGETLVDFIPAPDLGPGRYVARPGGAPANVAVGLARLGRRVAFVGRAGVDSLGALLVATLGNAGVDAAWIQRDERRPTTVAVVMPPSDSLVRFLIFGSGTAAFALDAEQIPLAAIRSARLLHVGTLSMIDPLSRRATRLAVAAARDSGVAISLDVNLRTSAWPSRTAMRRAARELLDLASVVKATPEELAEIGTTPKRLTGGGVRVLLVTDGDRGATAWTSETCRHLPAPVVSVVDPTGAGDAFMAAFIDGILLEADHSASGVTCWLANPPSGAIESVLGRAIRAGALAVGKIGATGSLPLRRELDEAYIG